MKPSPFFLAGLLAAALALAAPGLAWSQGASAPPAGAALQDPAAQAAYAIGFNIGMSMRKDGVTVDPALLVRGLQDGLASAKPALTEDQMRAAVSQLQASVQARQQEQAAQAAQTNKAQGAAFLKANATRPGVVSLPDGLQYQIIKAGTGPTPKAEDTVVCNYRGTLISGAEFDSSEAHGGPASFSVGGVIKGWTEALQRMPVGSKWRLFVPADLAYGDRGAGADIGPGAVLVFEVELVSIQPKA